ncbi:hypothetical protein scyTo_0002991 [Scyliorhinus torazame]|uniref:Uncharacterized protein n=1 Tax=Scyliorhinus torazame TaxID=75743 RepID=A0A401PLB0_SCYTO|nr:hypothetical protein [Scyliorhinus torazame]
MTRTPIKSSAARLYYNGILVDALGSYLKEDLHAFWWAQQLIDICIPCGRPSDEAVSAHLLVDVHLIILLVDIYCE